jgi:hypothetical protein
MSSSPDDAANEPNAAVPKDSAAPKDPATPAEAVPAAPQDPAAPAEAALAVPKDPTVPVEAAPATPGATESKAPAPLDEAIHPKNFLLYTVFTLLCTGIALWLVFASAGYKNKYSQKTEGWQLGSTRMIEITLIREDKKNLACASEKFFGAIHCGYRLGGLPFGPMPENDPHILQPFNTVKNELFLAAGLWQAPILQGTLPAERFTVVCNYHILGVLKAVSLRWSPTASFNPADQSVTVGTVSDCVIPQ